MFVCLFSLIVVIILEELADLCVFALVPELGAPGNALPVILGKRSFSSCSHLAKGQTLPQSASRCNATLMYLYFCNVFWPKTVGKVRFLEETKSINFCVVTFVLAFCSMGQTVSSVKVGQDQRSLKYKGVGVKPTSFHPPSFSFFFLGHTEAAMPRNTRLSARSFFDWFAVHCHCKFVSRTTCQMSVQKNKKTKKKPIIKVIQSSQGVII